LRAGAEPPPNRISVTSLNGDSVYSLNDAQLFPPHRRPSWPPRRLHLPAAGLDPDLDDLCDGRWNVDSSGTLHGNLLLLGVGDPTLDGGATLQEPGATPAELRRRRMDVLDLIALQVLQSGVRKIDGNVVGTTAISSTSRSAKGGLGRHPVEYGAAVSHSASMTMASGLSFAGKASGRHQRSGRRTWTTTRSTTQ